MWKVEYGDQTERYRNRIAMDLLQGVLNKSDVKSARCVLHHVIGSVQDALMAKGFYIHLKAVSTSLIFSFRNVEFLQHFNCAHVE